MSGSDRVFTVYLVISLTMLFRTLTQAPEIPVHPKRRNDRPKVLTIYQLELGVRKA